MPDDSTTDVPDDDNTEQLSDRVQRLEDRNSELRDEKRKLENQYRNAENERQRVERELKHLKSELEKLKSPPLVVGYVEDILEDGRLILESSTGPNFVVQAADFIEEEDIQPGARVSLNQQSLNVVGVLPPSVDPQIYGAEVIEAPDVGYEDVGGLQDQVRDLRESVELPLTEADRFDELGVDPPKGVLLHGPPGTGKTLLAKAVANHTNATFIKLAGSELVQKYIGEGARLVRELFELARERAPSILFIDELDAIGSRRYEASTSGDREVQRTLMQLLAEMDGFTPRGDVRIVAATNRSDMLDSALLRPGRFDRLIEFPLPDLDEREEIFAVHTRDVNVAEDLDLRQLAVLIGDEATGADIQAVCTEAGMFALRADRDAVQMEDFRRAVDKHMGQKLADQENVAKDAAFA
jgi:proteasome regulatory subunit